MIKRSTEADRRRWHSRTLRAHQGLDSVFISHSDLPSTPRPASVSSIPSPRRHRLTTALQLQPAATVRHLHTHHCIISTQHNTQPAATLRTRQVPQSGETHFWHDFTKSSTPKCDHNKRRSTSTHTLWRSAASKHAEDHWGWYSQTYFLVSFLYVRKLNLVL